MAQRKTRQTRATRITRTDSRRTERREPRKLERYADIQREREISPLAIWSLVISILSILGIFATGLSIILAITAIILGFMALSQIRRENMRGRGYAIWGIVLGIISIILFILFIAILGAIGVAIFNALM